jgi:hypothetical protein
MVDFPIPNRWSPPRIARTATAPFDASAAIIASLVSAALVLVAWWVCSTSIYQESPWKLPRMLAAVVTGPRVLFPEDELDVTVVGTGIVVHCVVALAFGAILCALTRRVPDGAVAWAGAASGGALYFIDLHAMTTFFPWFAPMRTPDTVAAHVLLGILIATAYRHLVPAAR